MSEFAGFETGRGASVPVPDAFFSVVLPGIESVYELKVTLHLFWLLFQRRGLPKAVALSELEQDRLLLRSLKISPGPRPAIDYLREGLELAVVRGTILQVSTGQAAGKLERWYLVNSPASREAVRQLAHEEVEIGDVLGRDIGPVEVVRIYRPNIFTLYERNIGMLSPIIADGLREAELAYPHEWIAEAIRLAVEYNKRSWAYISGILKRWEVEGKSSGSDRRHPEAPGDSEKYTTGKYGHLVES
jgi:DnaD/phage-associated family protein